MYKSNNSVNNFESGSDSHEHISLALAIMTDALQGSPGSLELKTHPNEWELLEKHQILWWHYNENERKMYSEEIGRVLNLRNTVSFDLD